MSLAGAGLGGMSIAEAYTVRKIHREITKKPATSASAGGILQPKKPPAKSSGRRLFGKTAPQKCSAKVLDLMATE